MNKWFYWDFKNHRTEFDKYAHFAYPFFFTVLFSTLGMYFQLPIHVVRVVIFGMIIGCVFWELGELAMGKDKISGGDLIADALGITAGALCISAIEHAVRLWA